MKQINMDVVENMFASRSSNHILASAVKMCIPKNDSKWQCFISLLISIILSYLIATSNETVTIFHDGVFLINDVFLALFSIVFTGYAFFQALIGKEMLIRLFQETVRNGEKDESKFQEINELFADVMMIILLCIFISIILILVLKCVPQDANILESQAYNELLAGIGISMYFYMVFMVLFEIKSFIFNVFELFNFHAGTKILEYMSENDSEQ